MTTVVGASILDSIQDYLGTYNCPDLRIASVPGYMHGNFNKEKKLMAKIKENVDENTKVVIIQISGNSMFPGRKYSENGTVHYHSSLSPTHPTVILRSITYLISQIRILSKNAKIGLIPPFIRRQEKTTCDECLIYPKACHDVDLIGNYIIKNLRMPNVVYFPLIVAGLSNSHGLLASNDGEFHKVVYEWFIKPSSDQIHVKNHSLT